VPFFVALLAAEGDDRIARENFHCKSRIVETIGKNFVKSSISVRVLTTQYSRAFALDFNAVAPASKQKLSLNPASKPFFYWNRNLSYGSWKVRLGGLLIFSNKLLRETNGGAARHFIPIASFVSSALRAELASHSVDRKSLFHQLSIAEQARVGVSLQGPCNSEFSFQEIVKK
jgi:hypothetical protein